MTSFPIPSSLLTLEDNGQGLWSQQVEPGAANHRIRHLIQSAQGQEASLMLPGGPGDSSRPVCRQVSSFLSCSLIVVITLLLLYNCECTCVGGRQNRSLHLFIMGTQEPENTLGLWLECYNWMKFQGQWHEGYVWRLLNKGRRWQTPIVTSPALPSLRSSTSCVK